MTNNSPIRITPDNLSTLEYIPETGTEYEIAPGVIRKLKKRVYSVQMSFDELLAKEDSTQSDPTHESYPYKIRPECAMICTDGDKWPKDPDMDIVDRICVDFFSLRVLKPRPQSS